MNMNEFPERRFGKEGRPRGWHTAFYYLAEHVKFLTAGAINHKGLYALVGVDGTVNDANPRIRKNVAGKLSTIVHSKEYAVGLRHGFVTVTSTFTIGRLKKRDGALGGRRGGALAESTNPTDYLKKMGKGIRSLEIGEGAE